MFQNMGGDLQQKNKNSGNNDLRLIYLCSDHAWSLRANCFNALEDVDGTLQLHPFQREEETNECASTSAAITVDYKIRARKTEW